MKPRIKSTIWNTRKKKAFDKNSRKKKELKKTRIASETSGISPNVPIPESYG